MLSTFPSINVTKEIPIKNISIGEYYYIQSGKDLFHGKVDHVTNQCIEFTEYRKAGSSSCNNASYLTAPSIVATFCWSHEDPEVLVDEVNISVAINHSKTMLATGMSNNQVILRDLNTMKIVQTLGDDENEWVLCVKFNMPGTMIAAASTSSSVRIWSTSAPYALLYFIQHIGTYVNELLFALNDSVLIYNGGGGEYVEQFQIVFWSLESNKCINSIPILKETLAPDNVDRGYFVGDDNIYVNAFEVSPDFLIASVTVINGVSVIAVWNIDPPSQRVSLKRFHNVFTKLMYDINLNAVFACGIDGGVHVLEIPTLNVLYTISLENSPNTRINTASLNNAHDKLIARTREGDTYVYNLTERVFEQHCPVLDSENYDEEHDLSLMVEFGLGELYFIACSAYEIIRVPLAPTFRLIADEFRVECVFIHSLPDAVKWLIREFLSGVAQV